MKIKLMACAAMAALCATGAHAQAAGDIQLNAGWMHFAPQDSSDPFNISALGQSMTSPGAGASVSNSDTLGLTAAYFFTDHIAVEGVAGVAPKFHLDGKGTLGRLGELGTAREWSPTLLLKYYFMSAQSKFRPYVGAGASYVWFSDVKLSSAMSNGAFLYSPQFGTALTGPTTAHISSSFAPVVNAGFAYNFTQHWSAAFSVSYMWLSARATLTTNSAVGTVRSESKIKLDPIVTFLSVGYRF
ncbi:OmpW family outer membrane protein [Caballeronia sp. LP006]|uniref:OmpW/AlkL family protein n=1 Tax=Caballeronia sp. GAWG1-1 TaxID=2921742 RepID=UPI00202883B7|nr:MULTISPECIES: OmpW family outer membrane protein [unclassified Caballeronia]MDR5805641.1 OmpW family outer membrane protein [Caballeronia sp. LZ001]MDR5826884.1 OmpW family outer membrane protein [Caballeronia sp. LP006]